MAFQIISVMEKQGEFKDKPYHNFLVYCVEPDTTNPQVRCGCEVDMLKIKADDFVAMLNRNIGALNNPNIKTVKDIVGLHILPVYGKFSVVKDFVLSVPEKKK